MNKAYRLLLIGGGSMLVIAILSYVVFRLQGWLLPSFYMVLPIYFLALLSGLALIVKRFKDKQTILDVGAILGIKMVFLILSLAIFVAGVITDKENILAFTVLFVMYYIVFLISQTIILMKLTKNEI